MKAIEGTIASILFLSLYISARHFMLAEVDRDVGIKLLCFKQIGFEAKEILEDSIEVEQIVQLCLFPFDIFAFALAPFHFKLRGT